MSKGIEAYQAATQGFNSSDDQIRQYVNDYDTDFFTNWRDKAGAEVARLTEGATAAGSAGTAVVAAKQLRKGVTAFRSKYLNKSKDGGDEDGKGDGDEEDPLGEDPVSDTPASVGTEPDPLAEDTVPFPEVEPPSSAPPTIQSDDAVGDLDESPLQQPSSMGTESAAGSTESGAADVADVGAEVGAETGGEAAGAATAAVGSAVGDAAIGALSVGLDAIAPLGLLAGVGVGLYEIFHHPTKPPPPPIPTSAASKGEMLIPSFDSVTDTPASMSAF